MYSSDWRTLPSTRLGADHPIDPAGPGPETCMKTPPTLPARSSDDALLAEAFSTAEAATSPPRTPAWWVAVATTWAGALLFAAALAVPSLAGDWDLLLWTTGLVAVGGLAQFHLRHAGTEPGVRNDGVFFRSLTRRGALGWLAGVGMTAFYCILYWWDDAWGTSPLQVASRWSTRSPEPRRAARGQMVPLRNHVPAVLLMGVRMLWRYRHCDTTCGGPQASCSSVGLAFLLPQLLKNAGQPEFYFSYFWPLKPEHLRPSAWGGPSMGYRARRAG